MNDWSASSQPNFADNFQWIIKTKQNNNKSTLIQNVTGWNAFKGKGLWSDGVPTLEYLHLPKSLNWLPSLIKLRLSYYLPRHFRKLFILVKVLLLFIGLCNVLLFYVVKLCLFLMKNILFRGGFGLLNNRGEARIMETDMQAILLLAQPLDTIWFC